MRRAYLLPNLFTTLSLFCGVMALFNIWRRELIDASWLILLSIILDGLDGRIARLTRTQSRFGLNYDSLSDLVAFGVAPAMLVFAYLWQEGVGFLLVAGVCSLYIICGALRLARFNVQFAHKQQETFKGLPIPGAAGALIAMHLLFQNVHSPVYVRFLPIMVVFLSYLMVSNIRYPAFKHLAFQRRKAFEYLVSMLGSIAILWILLPWKEWLLFIAFWGYISFGLALYVIKVPLRQVEPESSQAEEKESEI